MRGAFLFAAFFMSIPAFGQDVEVVRDGVEDRPWDVSAVGGVGGFTGALSGVTDPGPLWGVQVDAQVARHVHLELSYSGFAFPITDSRVVDQVIWGHGGAGGLKLSWPYTRTVSPFVSAGLGVSKLDPTDGAAHLFRGDTIVDIPASIGIEFETDFFQAGIRGTWRGLLGESVAREAQVGEPHGGVLVGALTLGLRL